MDCIKCGRSIPDDSRYCCYCGIKDPSKRKTQNGKSRGNGQGSVWKAKNGTWTAQVSIGRYEGKLKRRTKSGFKTKKEALEYLPTLAGTHFVGDANMTISAIWEVMSSRWLDPLSDEKRKHYIKAYERLRPLWGANIKHLVTNDWQVLIDQIPGALYPKKDAKTVASKIYQYAIAQGWITVNMAEYITLPGQSKPQKDAFSHEELDALWTDYNAGYTWTAYILIMCYTGMRPGELRSVKLEDIHLDELYMVGGIKTDAGIRRMIGFPAFLRPVVQWAAEHGKNGKLLAISEENFYKEYNAALDHAGIVRTKDHPMTPHCCRHTFITEGVSAGIPLAMLQKMAGHSDVSVTAQYNHSHDPELLEQIQRLYRPKDLGQTGQEGDNR